MDFEDKLTNNLYDFRNNAKGTIPWRSVLPHHTGTDPELIPDNKHPHELDLEELRKLPKFLTAAIARSGDQRTLLYDHLAYWGWTTAYLLDNLIWEPKDWHRKSAERVALQLNVGLIVQLFLIPRRADKLGDEATASALINNPGLFLFTEKNDSTRLATSPAFSTLEGLLMLHCKELETTGRAKEEFTISLERDGTKQTFSDGQGVGLYHALMCWSQNNASPAVSKALTEINFKSDQEIESVIEMVRGLDHRVTDPDATDFFGLIVDQRHYNAHGEGSTSIISPIILTLICLLIWDAVNEAQYLENRQSVVQGIKNTQIEFAENQSYDDVTKHYNDNYPSLFYPIYPTRQSL